MGPFHLILFFAWQKRDRQKERESERFDACLCYAPRNDVLPNSLLLSLASGEHLFATTKFQCTQVPNEFAPQQIGNVPNGCQCLIAQISSAYSSQVKHYQVLPQFTVPTHLLWFAPKSIAVFVQTSYNRPQIRKILYSKFYKQPRRRRSTEDRLEVKKCKNIL